MRDLGQQFYSNLLDASELRDIYRDIYCKTLLKIYTKEEVINYTRKSKTICCFLYTSTHLVIIFITQAFIFQLSNKICISLIKAGHDIGNDELSICEVSQCVLNANNVINSLWFSGVMDLDHIGSRIGVLPDDNKTLSETMLTQWSCFY